METLSHSDFMILNRAIGDMYAARDRESFYRAVFDSLREIIPSDHSSFTDMNSQTHRILKIIPRSEDHTNVVKQLADVFQAHSQSHPLMPHCLSGDVVKVTDFVSKERFKDTAIHTDFYRHLATDSQISFALPLSQNTLTLFTLSRSVSDFSERDRLVLMLLRSHMITAMRNVLELDQLRLERDLLQKGAETGRQAAILFQYDGMIICISFFAKELLAQYFGVSLQEGDTLPGSLLQWVTAELPAFGGATVRMPSAGVPQRVERAPLDFEKEGRRLTIRLLNDMVTGDQILFMTEKPLLTSSQLVHQFNLSRREADVVLLLSQGKTNAEIAIILGMSKRTAEKHLERIFAKLGVETRTAAAAIIVRNP